MGFTFKTLTQKVPYVVFQGYGSNNTIPSYENMARMGYYFLEKKNRNEEAIEVGSVVENIIYDGSSLAVIISRESGEDVLEVKLPSLEYGNRIFYFYADGIDLNIVDKNDGEVCTITDGNLGCIFGSKGTLFSLVNIHEGIPPLNLILFPMGIIAADDFEFRTAPEGELVDIEGKAHTTSASIQANFSMIRLYDDKVSIAGNEIYDYSKAKERNLVVYGRRKRLEESLLIIMEKVDKSRNLEVVGNELSKTIYALRREEEPSTPSLKVKKIDDTSAGIGEA